jgi:signal transduction histidine kinase
VNTPRNALARLEVGGFTVLLTLVLVLMVGGLIATDRVLGTLATARREDDAVRVGLQLERIISARATGLTVFQALGMEGRARDVDTANFRALAKNYALSRVGTRRILLTDSHGTIIEEAFADTAPDSVLIGPLATRNTSTADVAEVSVRSPPHGAPLLIVTQPLAGPRPVWAIAVVDLHKISGTLIASPLDSGIALTLVAQRDTVVLDPGRATVPSRLRIVAAPVHLPDGTTWTLNVGTIDEVYDIRRALWVFGLLTILLLGLSVLRERRQAIAIRQRSAELERLSSELLRANRMKSEFLASVSHELRTPLNAIVGFVELLKDGVYGDLSPRQVAPFDRIAVSARHLRELVDQVLDIAKIAAGRLEVHTETVSLRVFVLNVASELESLFKERGLNFSISIPTALPRIRTDPTHLRQILVNLIGNAVKYTPAGEVAVRARLVAPGGPSTTPGRRHTPGGSALTPPPPDRARSWIALQIVDTGVGIPAADFERIFDEFEQVNAGSRGDSMSRGTGLGLAISRRLARLLGGDVVVESQMGKGSTFTVWIPVPPGAAAAAPESRTLRSTADAP